MNNFIYQNPTKLVFGKGQIAVFRNSSRPTVVS